MIFEGMVKIRGAWLNCKLTGSTGELEPGKPVVMVLPDGPGLGFDFYEKQLHGFDDLAHFMYFDSRGSGLSEHAVDPSHYSMDADIEDIEAVRSHFKLGTVMLLGLSYGSFLALGYALQYPANVKQLILVGGAATHHFLDEAKDNLQKRGTPEQIDIAKKLWAGEFESDADMKKYYEVMTPLYTQAKGRRIGPKLTSQRVSYAPLNQAMKTRFGHFNFYPILDRIKCPVKILVGENDWINSLTELRKVAAKLPHAELDVVPNCATMLTLDAPFVFRRVLRELLTPKPVSK